ncbi:MAG TPA: hypothetical protein PKD59_10470 [Miltoncostaeaceae bacterium]|nr:hypothetical protein [Miltoncostaeaceae bacterium]
MFDPITALTVGEAALTVGEAVLPLVRRLGRSDEATRLFKLLDDEFAGRSGFSMVFWRQLSDDAPFILALAPCLAHGDGCDQAALARAIAPHVWAMDGEGSPEETAQEIAEAIERLAPRAKMDARSAMHHGFERLEARVARGHAPIRLSWAPRMLTDQLMAVAEAHPDVARGLGDALGEDTSRAATAAALVRAPQPWLDDAPAQAWHILSSICEAYGDHGHAIEALERAARQPGPRPARHLAHAAMIAARNGRADEARRLLDDARALDPKDVAVCLAEADSESDARARLELLGQISPTEPGDRAQAACLAGEAHAHMHEIDEALARIADARRHAPDSPRPNEIEAMARLIYAAGRFQEVGPHQPHLARAAQLFASLAIDMEAFGRLGDGAVLRARSAQCHLLLGQRPDAARSLAAVRADLVVGENPEAAVEVASTLIDLGRCDDAAELLKHIRGRDPQVELVLAEARVGSRNGARRRAGLETLDRLLSADSEKIRTQAAFMRQSLAVKTPTRFPASAKAREVLAEVDPATAALMWVDAAELVDRKSIETVLLPFSGDARVLHRLADVAAADGDHLRALELINAAADRTSRPGVHLRRAHLLILAGREDEALPGLRAMQDNVQVVTAARVDAVRLELEVQARRRAWLQFERVTRRWLEVDPASVEAGWHLVHVLARLGRYDEARAHLDRQALDPDILERAELAAAVLYRTITTADDLEQLALLADRFDGESEGLELTLLSAGTALGEAPLPSTLKERLRTGWEQFEARFPDSTALTRVEIGEDLEGLSAYMREHLADAVESERELMRQVADGEVPLAFVAGARGTEATTVWGRVRPLPVGFANETLEELELADAAAAIGGPVVFDPAALVVAGGLGPSLRDVIVGALPGSVVPQAVLDDADSAEADLVMAAGQSERGFLGWDPDSSTPVLTEMSPQEDARDQARARGVLELAQRLKVVPDTDPAHPHPLDEALAERQSRRGSAFLTWPATHSVAERLRMPIFSDDRVVRVHARRAGVNAFGTVGLLDALVDLSMISADQRASARGRLWASGANGLTPSVAELVEAGRRAEWDLSDEIGAMLLDATSWRFAPAEANRRAVAFLAAVHSESPAELPRWVMRILRGAHIANDGKLSMSGHAVAMIIFAWEPADHGPAPFLQALIRALRRAGAVFGFGDPLPGAINHLERTRGGPEAGIVSFFLWSLLGQVEAGDALRAICGPKIFGRHG